MNSDFFYERIHRAENDQPYIDLYMTNLNYLSHFHHEIEFIYVVSGDVNLHINSRTYNLKEGDTGVIMPGEIHSYSCENPNKCYIIKFFPSVKSEELDFSSIRFSSHTVKKNCCFYSEFRNCIEDIASEALSKQAGYQLAINKNLLSAILLFMRGTPYIYTSEQENKKQLKQLKLLEEVDGYVQKNYKNEISLKDIADYCGYSVYYFSHFFKDATGQTFADYLMLFRIERAMSMISSTDKSLTDIAFDCGFNSIRTFNRAFQNKIKTTPSAYRNSLLE